MSGHSHFATIKRQKEAKDQARGRIFSKMARLIAIAVKTGGGPNPDGNYKLQAAIEKARSYNMPKANIDRAIQRAGSEGDIEEVRYEGFGPGGVLLMIDAATDNKNRTVQELKGILERGGGGLGAPGSASYNFDSKGVILVKKESDLDRQTLRLIDLGVEDLEVREEGIEVYVPAGDLLAARDRINAAGFEVLESDLIQKPKASIRLPAGQVEEKFERLIDELNDHDDVQNVWTNRNAG